MIHELFDTADLRALAKRYIGAQSVVRQVHADLLLVAAAAVGVPLDGEAPVGRLNLRLYRLPDSRGSEVREHGTFRATDFNGPLVL